MMGSSTKMLGGLRSRQKLITPYHSNDSQNSQSLCESTSPALQTPERIHSILPPLRRRSHNQIQYSSGEKELADEVELLWNNAAEVIVKQQCDNLYPGEVHLVCNKNRKCI